MPNEPTADDSVSNHADAHRYEITHEGAPAGFAEYRTVTPAGIVFTHTVIHDEFEGKGLGGKLAKAALDDVRIRRLSVTAECSFIAGYIARHPEYADLLA